MEALRKTALWSGVEWWLLQDYWAANNGVYSNHFVPKLPESGLDAVRRVNAPVQILIAEVGVNHNGDPNLAAELVDIARDVGADAVKFQTFEASALVTSAAEKARYQKAVTKDAESQREMLEQLQLDAETHFSLMRQAQALDRSIARPFHTSNPCLLYTSPSPRDGLLSRMPSSA